MLLIQISDLAPYKDVSQNIDAIERFNPYVQDAQRFDVAPIIGEQLYLALITGAADSPVDAKWTTLLDGTTYTPKNETYPVNFYGLKAAIIYFAYARFILNQSVTVTRAGVKYKTMANSENIPEGFIQKLAETERSKARSYMDGVLKYLDENEATYPEYKTKCDSRPIKARMFTVNRKNFF